MSVDFGKLVDDARRAKLGRRGFLAAALALGIGADDAVAELPRRVHSVPSAPPLVWVGARIESVELVMWDGERRTLGAEAVAKLQAQLDAGRDPLVLATRFPDVTFGMPLPRLLNPITSFSCNVVIT